MTDTPDEIIASMRRRIAMLEGALRRHKITIPDAVNPRDLLNAHMAGRSYANIAREIGVSQQRVRRHILLAYEARCHTLARDLWMAGVSEDEINDQLSLAYPRFWTSARYSAGSLWAGSAWSGWMREFQRSANTLPRYRAIMKCEADDGTPRNDFPPIHDLFPLYGDASLPDDILAHMRQRRRKLRPGDLAVLQYWEGQHGAFQSQFAITEPDVKQLTDWCAAATPVYTSKDAISPFEQDNERGMHIILDVVRSHISRATGLTVVDVNMAPIGSVAARAAI